MSSVYVKEKTPLLRVAMDEIFKRFIEGQDFSFGPYGQLRVISQTMRDDIHNLKEKSLYPSLKVRCDQFPFTRWFATWKNEEYLRIYHKCGNGDCGSEGYLATGQLVKNFLESIEEAVVIEEEKEKKVLILQERVADLNQKLEAHEAESQHTRERLLAVGAVAAHAALTKDRVAALEEENRALKDRLATLESIILGKSSV
jgi:hypothetical protein